MKKIIILASLLLATAAQAETPVYPTTAMYAPTRAYNKTASWTLTKRPRGYLATITAAMRFDPAISDYITCKIPGMAGLAGDETVRFSVTFSETKTLTVTGFVPGTALSLVCASEGQKLTPIQLDAAMTAISVDQATKR